MERLRQEALDLESARDRELVVLRELVHAKDRDDVLERLVSLQHLLHVAGELVMLIADDKRREHARSRVKRIDRRIDALFGDRARQHGGRVEMGKAGRGRRIREVVRRHIDRLHRGHRALGGRGDALLQGAHVGCERRLVADRGNAADSAETSEPAWVKRKILSTKNSTSMPWSRKYSATVKPDRLTRARAPGGSFIWP
jgi:hypothetical protein